VSNIVPWEAADLLILDMSRYPTCICHGISGLTSNFTGFVIVKVSENPMFFFLNTRQCTSNAKTFLNINISFLSMDYLGEQLQ